MFAAYEVSLELVRELRGVMTALRKHDRELASQLHRAATSIVLNLAEGRDRCGGDQRHCYEIAAGSAGEVRAALDAAEAWGWPLELARSRVVADKLGGLLYGLTRRRR
ncbi:MAG TPA: four helix bundle protein [Kofleriaceae bacterium]|nr:four helix bundle protein [Kofleriaceae bacterium]